MFESFGKWNFDYVYIDEKANEEQREALKELSLHFFPPAAKAREYRYVPVTRKIEGEEHITTIGTYGVCSGHLIEGGSGGAPKVMNPRGRSDSQGISTRGNDETHLQRRRPELEIREFQLHAEQLHGGQQQYEKHEGRHGQKNGENVTRSSGLTGGCGSTSCRRSDWSSGI